MRWRRLWRRGRDEFVFGVLLFCVLKRFESERMHRVLGRV